MNADEGYADQGSTGPTPIDVHHPRAIRVHPRSSAAKNPLPAAARHRTPGHGARTRTRQQPKPRPRAYSSPAAAAAREAGVSISSGATGPSYVYPKNARRSGLVMFSQPGYGRIAFSSGLKRRM